VRLRDGYVTNAILNLMGQGKQKVVENVIMMYVRNAVKNDLI